MPIRSLVSSLCIFIVVTGCAHIDFGGDGLTYYEPKPFLFVIKTKDCVITATIVVVPADKKTMKFISGYGSSDLSITLSNGMITAVGQKTDTKVPETLTSIASLATAAAALELPATGMSPTCTLTATLYPLESGLPNFDKPSKVPLAQ